MNSGMIYSLIIEVSFMKQFIKSVITRSTLYYTISVSIFCIMVLFTNASDDSIATDPARLLLFLPFCVCFGLANTVMSYKNIEAFTRWLVHAILTILSAFIFIILPSGINTDSGNFMGFVIIVAIYLFGVLFSAILTARVRKTIKEDKELTKNSK